MSREVLELAWMRKLVTAGLVREIRTEAGLTLSEVGRSVGVTPSCVHYWERGHQPRGKAAVRYARLLLELESLSKR
jgi:DNA-binding transcriptional regulator YiaG